MTRHDMELRHLEMADRHLAEGAERIANQEALLANMSKNGHDTTEASHLLVLLKRVQEDGIVHRRLILEALGETDGRPTAK